MARIENWNAELRTWLSPFLEKLCHKARRQMCPLYVSGLIGPGDRKSVQPRRESICQGSASTTLADSFMQRFGADPSSAVRTSLRWQSSDERDDGVAHGRQAWLGRWSVVSFFPASLLRGGDAEGRRKRSSS
jgi:hypothetical protein